MCIITSQMYTCTDVVCMHVCVCTCILLTCCAFFNACAAHAHQQGDAHVRRDKNALSQEL